jgi:hypothetical protein
MPTSTVAAIITRIRQEADIETPTPDDDFITDTEITGFINQARKRLVDFIINVGGSDLLATSADVLQAGVAALTPYRVLGVDRIVSTTDTCPYRKWQFEERHRHTDPANPSWRWFANTLTWLPSAPTVAFRLWYIPLPTTLDDDADTVQNFNGWDDYIVAWGVIQCQQKAERDTSEWKGNLVDAMKRVEDAVTQFGPQSPDTISDVQTFDEDFFDLTVY